MSPALLLDEMYSSSLAEELRGHGHDVWAVVELVAYRGCTDAVLLQIAADEDHCRATENVRDFAMLVREMSHAGVLFVNSRRWPRVPSALPRLAQALHDTIKTGQLPGRDDTRWLA